MATIGSNLFTTGATNGASSGPFSEGGTPAANDTGTFMHLVTGMIQGQTTADQLPSNLAAFLLTGDSGALEGLEGGFTETDDSTDLDDEDGEDSELLALAALLPGLQPAALQSGGPAGSGDGARVISMDASGRQNALLTLLDTSQASLSEIVDDAAAEALATDETAGAAPTQPSGSAQLHHLLQAHKAAETAPQAASAEVRTPVGNAGWSDEIGTHLTMMAANGREAASLRLSPEHLGPLEIRISMKDGEASVLFGAANPETRNALEQSLPRLREMFASQGLVLGDANVSRDPSRDNFKPATFANATRGSSDTGSDGDVKRVTLSRIGLVDTYV